MVRKATQVHATKLTYCLAISFWGLPGSFNPLLKLLPERVAQLRTYVIVMPQDPVHIALHLRVVTHRHLRRPSLTRRTKSSCFIGAIPPVSISASRRSTSSSEMSVPGA